jgi:hypothetical protein
MATTPFSALNAACLKTFGSPVAYQQGAGAPFAVTGIFQKETDEERQQDGVFARLFVKLADFASRPERGDFVTVNGTTYTVFDVAVDSTSGVSLSLKKHG